MPMYTASDFQQMKKDSKTRSANNPDPGDEMTCPVCHFKSPVDLTDRISYDDHPDAVEGILSGQVFQFSCEVCGKVSNILYDILIYSREGKWVISYLPEEFGKSDTYDVKLPDGPWSGGEWRKRIVCGPRELAEKIRIFSSGLDDIAIERLKTFAKDRAGNIVLPEDKIEFERTDRSAAQCSQPGFERGAMVFDVVSPHHSPLAAADRKLQFNMDLYYAQAFTCGLDARMKASGAPEHIDSDWMHSRLSLMSVSRK